MTWTDAEREEAALACAMMASSNSETVPGNPAAYFPDAINKGCHAADLARAALWSVGYWRELEERERWAEAEARLRCGWTP